MTYTCPMHPNIKQDTPGMCPECGMNLVKMSAKGGSASGGKKHAGNDKHAGHKTESFLTKFWISLVLTIPVVIWRDERWITFVLGSIVFWYCGWIFLASAGRELRAKLPGMMTLIALAIISAYSYSVYVTLADMTMALYWELTR